MKKPINSIRFCLKKTWRLALVPAVCGLGVQLFAAQTTIYKANTTTLFNPAADWSTTSGGTTYLGPGTNEIGDFDGTISALNEGSLTLGGNIQLDALQFLGTLNGAVTINADGNTLMLGTSAGTIGIQAGSANASVTINCPIALIGNADTWNCGANGVTINGALTSPGSQASWALNGGTVNLNGGATNLIGTYFSVESGTLDVTNAAITVAPTYRFNVGWNTTTPGVLNISNATLTMNSTVEFDLGGNYNGGGTGSGVINIGGVSAAPGLLNITQAGTERVGVTVGQNGTGTLNLNGSGTLETVRTITLYSNATVNCNGGALQLGANVASLISLAYPTTPSAATISLNSGGLNLNPGGYVGGISVPLTGGGGVTIVGAGTILLTTNNTYSGNTTINAGKLMWPSGTSSASNSPVVVSGGTLSVTNAVLGKQWTCASLTTSGATPTLDFNFGSLLPSNTVAPLNVLAGVTFSTAPSVTVEAGSFPASTGNGYPLLSWGTGSAPNLSGVTVTLSTGRIPAALATVGNTLYLQITGTSTEPLSWTGGNGTWDINDSANKIWHDNTGASTYYQQGVSADSVVFDNLVGTGGTVTLSANVAPASLAVNLTNVNYTLAGTGTITNSSASFTQSGNGTLALNAANNYTVGVMTLAGGSLQNGKLTASGYTLQSGSISSVLAGGGAVTKSTTGTVTLSGANTYSGATTLAGGTLALSGANNVLPVGSAVSFTTNATLNLGGNSQTLASVTMASPSVAYANSPASTIANGVLTVSGAGAFNPATTNLTATMDFSGLAGVYFTNAAQTFTLNMNNSTANGTAILNLATNGTGTNFIAATTMNLGAGGTIAASVGATDILNLGPWNTFWVNNFTMGSYRQQLETVGFSSGLTTSNLTVMGTGGANRVAGMSIGEWNSGIVYNSGNLIVGAGTFNCSVSNLLLGVHNITDTTAGRVPLATLDLGAAGNFDCLLLTNGQTLIEPSTYGAVVWISQHGGNAHFQTMIMGDNSSTSAGCNLQSAYFLNGGTLFAQNIQPGNDGAGVSAASFRGINWTNGTIRNYNGTNALTIGPNSSGSPVTISAPGSGSRFFVVDSGLTNIINGPITQVNATNTPIVLNGPGTLDLQGTTSNYFLGLNVSNGVVLLDKQNAEAIGGGLTLNGGSAILAANGGSGGDQIADAGIVTINSGAFDLNGQTETIGGLAGAGGTLADASGGSATLTVNVATGANYTNASAISHGNLVIGLATGGGQGKQILTGMDSRSTSGSETTVINSGTLQIGNGGTGGSLAGSGITVNSPGFLAFDNSGTLNFAGSVNGNGSVAQNGAGSLTLSGSVSYTGNTLVNAGTLLVASGVTTLGGSPSTIAIASGATLNVTGGSGNFQVQGQQALSGSGSVTGSYQVSSGGTNSGNLTVNGSVTFFDGSVLNPGTFYTAGTITVNGNVTVASGNPQLIYTLAGATTSGGGINSLLVVSGTLDTSAGSPLLVIQGVPHSGTYTLATFGSFNGPGGPTDTSNLQVPVSGSFTFTPVINGHSLQLVVVGNPKSLVWQGDGSGNSWDANDSGNTDWSNTVAHALDYFSTADNVVFNDTSANLTVNLTADLLPSSLTVNATNSYTFANNGGYIDGPIALTKTNAGMLTIQTANTFVGPVNINGGMVSVDTVAPAGNAQPLGEGNIVNLNGGALQYTGSPVPVGQFSSAITLGSKGGTIDQESTGGIYFFVTNTISGSGSLTKSGPQQLILGDVPGNTGSNSYAGGTIINNGNLQLRNANALGTNAVWIYPGASLTEDAGFSGIIMNNVFLEGGTLSGGPAGYTFGGTVTLVTNSTVAYNTLTLSGQITGPAPLDLTSGTLTLLNNTNNYAGGTVVTAGTLQLGTNGASGWIAAQPAGVAITNNGTISFNRADTNAIPASIAGTGSLVQNGSGTTILGGSNTFTGNVTINGTPAGGVLFVTNSSALGGGVVTVNGSVNNGFLQLAGNLTVNNPITLGQKNTPNGGVGTQPPHISSVSGTNAILGAITIGAGGNYWAINSASGLLAMAAVNNTAGSFGRPLYLEGAGNGVITNLSDTTQQYLEINKQGAGVWTLAGASDLPAGLTVNQGTLIIAGTVDNGTNTGAATVAAGNLIVNGTLPGTVTVNSTGTIGGSGIITNAVTVNPGGTLVPSVYNTTITTLLTLNSNLTLSGNLFFNLNKTNGLTSDQVVVNGSLLTNTAAGTLTVTNYGPALTNGDTFTLFSQAVSNGAALNLVGGGASVIWSNNLALNGSITVLSVTPPVTVNTNPATADFGATLATGTLNFAWAPDHKGWQLYTNSVGLNATNSWFPVPGSANETNATITINPAKLGVFFQLRYP